MKDILIDLWNIEARKMRRGWPWYILGIVLFAVLPTLNFYFADGIYWNRVLTFKDADPMALETNSDKYCRGAAVYVETSFCKNRHISGYTQQWWLTNGELVPVRTTTEMEKNVQLPLGCYPEDGGTLTVKIHEIPKDAELGIHSSVGLTKYILEGGRVRELEMKTQDYEIVDCSI